MNYDTIAVLLTVVAGWWATHRDISRLRDTMNMEISQLRERMAKLEGLFEGFTGKHNEQQGRA
ncbi:MAG: hypothetical protein OXE42_18715 [Gammaproteobacteria bacterium]|nr:hypothetical protein [Gammaproteobacteria bacterium]